VDVTPAHAPSAQEGASDRTQALLPDVLRAVGNVLIGVALGLLGFYAVTATQGTASQAVLRQELAVLGEAAAEEPTVEPGPDFDWVGYEEQDVAYWEGLAQGGAFGRLVIPKLNVDATVVKGSTPRTLKRGPGWIEWTDLPGPSGTAGIAGHRTTYSAPFRRLDTLVDGDSIEFYSPFRRYRYEVTRVFEVTPDRVDAVASAQEPRLALSACHPPYSARLRLIVHADLVGVGRLAETSARPSDGSAP
jgi:sortase A